MVPNDRYIYRKKESKDWILLNDLYFNLICFEHLIHAFDKLVEWTGTGKVDKIKIREEVLSALILCSELKRQKRKGKA